jgi:hypothetical protein
MEPASAGSFNGVWTTLFGYAASKRGEVVGVMSREARDKYLVHLRGSIRATNVLRALERKSFPCLKM